MSVVIPAYKPGAGIDRVVASLDAQTLPQDEFELIVVDDGSPDDTWDRLQVIRDARSNVRIERIENSGWPSRPRNVGTDLALGEYVLYMDHDDELYPDGLRAAYEYATAHGADVLSPKESKTNDIGWGLGNYTGNIPNAKPKRGIASLLPMMPHKFYRTAFLREHDIRFPEGRRMLWEDIYFNVAAYRHADVISIFSTVPVYRWVGTDTNNSGTYGAGDEEYWEKLTALVLFVEETLAGPEYEQARHAILRHLYRSRVVARLYNAVAREPDAPWLPMARQHVQRLLEQHMPVDFDAHLAPVVRVRSALMRADRYDLFTALARDRRGWVPQPCVRALTWEESGALRIDVETRWRGADGEALLFRAADGRVLLDLPPAVLEVVGDAADVTEQVEVAHSQLIVRDPASSTTWTLPTTRTVTLVPVGDGFVTPVVAASAALDPHRRRADARWELHTKNTLVGHSAIRRVEAAAALPARLVHGRVVEPLVHRGGLAVDVHHAWGRVEPWSLDLGSVTVESGDGGIQVVGTLRTPDLYGKTGTSTGDALITPNSRILSKLLRSRRAPRLLKPLADRYVRTGWCRLHLPSEGDPRLRVSVPRLADGRHRLIVRPDGQTLPISLELQVSGGTAVVHLTTELGRT